MRSAHLAPLALLIVSSATAAPLTTEGVDEFVARAEAEASAVRLGAMEEERLDPLSVIGSFRTTAEVPGAAYLITPEALDTYRYADPLRVLRRVPGIYLQEEDGFGLRPNIGIRGSGVDRSARITLMEDGVLIAPAPYAAPSAYYFPTIRRMDSVEVLKGPASIAIGPRTTGGAINMRSTPIPALAGGRADMLVGQDGYLDLLADYGATQGRFGWLVQTVQQTHDGFKDLDGGGDTGFRIGDYMLRFAYADQPGANPTHRFELKVGSTEHHSDETYLGLTTDDFRATPLRRYAASQVDRMDNDHEQFQLTYSFRPEGRWDLSATLYRNDFARDWYKLHQVGGVDPGAVLDDPSGYASELSWLRGADSPVDALNVRHNNRSYYSTGLQLTSLIEVNTGSVIHDLELGLRIHSDQEDRFQWADDYRMVSGEMIRTTVGMPGTVTNRVSDADALAIHLRDLISFGSWQLSPGLRYEDIDTQRRDYDTAVPDRSTGPIGVRDGEVSELLLGMGATYALDEAWTLIAGVHEGFNPPSPGSASSAEESVNYELGARVSLGGWYLQGILFRNDYDNLVGTCTASTGGGCVIGDQFDGGRARVQGLELEIDRVIELDAGFDLPLGMAYTYTDTRFEEGFSSGFDPWGDVVPGDEFPYVPDHLLQLRAGLARGDWSLELAANYLDAVRTEAGQGPLVAGRMTDEAWVLDLAVHYQLSRRVGLFARVDNLLDETYLSALRPAGARPGKPRELALGIRVEL